MDRDPSAKDLIKRKLIEDGRVELAEILSKHWDTALEEYAPVSYTHLTLPTILRV